MKKRACAYARVSTNSHSQEHSFEFQSSYWNEELGNNPDYDYVGLYADKGISGKFASRRPQFLQMIEAARNGQIDIIFCKSVQRFARNTEELLATVRELRDIGVSVFFEKENINTLTIDSDLYLTIAAAVAEDDLTRYSQNVIWSLQDKYRKGELTMGGRLYGYNIRKGLKFEVNEKEASVVRMIYQMLIEGKSSGEIAESLNGQHLTSSNGGEWRPNQVRSILRNEKYAGDCLLQKTYSVNGAKKVNRGERDQYYVENHHTPIIDRETWEKAQKIMEQRSNKVLIGRVQTIYPFTGLITCKCCNRAVTHKMNHSGYDTPEEFWRCPTKRSQCTSTQLRDRVLKEKFVEAYNEFVTNKYKGIEENDIQTQYDALVEEQKELIRLNANGWITKSDFDAENGRIVKLLDSLNDDIERIRMRKITDKDYRPITVFDETKVEKFLKSVVLGEWIIEFHFYNGVVITKEYTNRYPSEITKRRK